MEPGFTQNLALNIAVNSSSYVNLVSRTLSVAGTAALQIRGTAADPVVLGRENLTGGDVILHGDRYVLTGGTVQFVNPTMTEPVLNVSLTTSIQEYKINLRINEPATQLRTQYSSDPALPPADIINLLAFGHTTEANAATQANQQPSVTQQAESLVASQVSSQVTSRISKAAGISQLSISPVLAGKHDGWPPGRPDYDSPARNGKSVRHVFNERGEYAGTDYPRSIPVDATGGRKRHARSERRVCRGYADQENLVRSPLASAVEVDRYLRRGPLEHPGLPKKR